MQNNIAQCIYEKIVPMPDSLAQEVLDFVDFIAQKHQSESDFKNMQLAQLSSLETIWENKEDDVWDNIKTY